MVNKLTLPSTANDVQTKINEIVDDMVVSVNGTTPDASGNVSLTLPIEVSTAVKGYLDNGQVLTDATGFNYVKYYSESIPNAPTLIYDVIPVSYEENGNPTHTNSDGIYSGFSANNYIKQLFELTSDYNTLEIDLGEVTISSLPSSGKTMWLFHAIETNSGISKGFWFGITSTGKSRLFAGSGDTNYDIASSRAGSIIYSAGQKVKFKLTYDGTKYTLYSSVNGGTWTQDGNAITSNKKINFNTIIKIGTDGSANYFQGSADLNFVKIIKDDEIVWQPCLKIPYVKSVTGSKVANMKYLERVKDMYSQKGYAPFYTIDLVNEYFTLPMGEIYGLMTTIIDSYFNTVTVNNSYDVTSWYVVFSNGLCVQGASATGAGSITQEQTITLLKPYKDTNYFIGGVGLVIDSIGSQFLYSKTSSSFTTAADVRRTGTNYWWTIGYLW